MISDPEFPAGLLYDPADRRVMYMADAGEKMMLHLVIQSSNQPGENRITCGEVHGCSHLVLSPMIFEASRIAGNREFRFFDHVGGLIVGALRHALGEIPLANAVRRAA